MSHVCDNNPPHKDFFECFVQSLGLLLTTNCIHFFRSIVDLHWGLAFILKSSLFREPNPVLHHIATRTFRLRASQIVRFFIQISANIVGLAHSPSPVFLRSPPNTPNQLISTKTLKHSPKPRLESPHIPAFTHCTKPLLFSQSRPIPTSKKVAKTPTPREVHHIIYTWIRPQGKYDRNARFRIILVFCSCSLDQML